jgi:hypothetical protein
LKLREQLIEASPQMDKENRKVQLAQPFLELLGWNLHSTGMPNNTLTKSLS